MARAIVSAEGRVVTWMDNDSFESVPEEDRPLVAEQFPVEFSNPEIFEETTSFSTEDYRIVDGMAVFDPLPESVEAIWRADAMGHAPEHMGSTDDAICELYEQALAQAQVMDEQDAAICALYELMIGE